MRLPRWLRLFACSLAFFSAFGSTTVAGQTSKMRGPPTSVPESILDDLVEMRQKFVALAQAMPSETWAWRPMEGVRSFREVMELVVVEGGLFPTMWGFDGLQGAEKTLSAEYARLGTLSEDGLTSELERALGHLIAIASGLTSEQWSRQTTFFSREVDVATALMYTAMDMHEHLGQAIAYARMNRVVPPWSRSE